MPEQNANIIFDEEASQEQRQAVSDFLEAAGCFNDSQLLSAMDIADKYPGATRTILPLTNNPDRVQGLFTSWQNLVRARAFEVVTFDKATEDAIASDDRFKKAIDQRSVNPEAARSSIVRLRFATFIGRAALAQAEKDSEESESTGQLPA